VQGVFFRDSAKRKAEELGVSGYARNMEDGSVLIEAEGGDLALTQLAEWCQDGPRESVVEKVEIENAKQKHYKDFKVL